MRSRLLDHRGDASRELVPLAPPTGERGLALSRDLVHAPAATLYLAPVARQKSFGLESVERGVDGAVGVVEVPSARQPNVLDHSIAVARLSQRCQQKQIEVTRERIACHT